MVNILIFYSPNFVAITSVLEDGILNICCEDLTTPYKHMSSWIINCPDRKF